MVPVALLVWLIAESAGYVLLARYVFDTTWAGAGFIALGGLLGVRAVIVAVTWGFARAYPSPAPRLSIVAWLRMLVGEYLAFLMCFMVVMPFERLWMAPDRLRPCARPLVLVHGYACSRSVWWWLRGKLEAAGHTVASVNLYPPYTSIGKLVPLLNQRVDEVCGATGSEQVVLIAHSMGGLVCRSYLARHGKQRVERLITIASPHAGTELARIGLGQNAREMETGSLWLRDLATEDVPVPTISIRTAHDNYVMPQDNQRLPGGIDIELDGIGHLAVLYSRRTASELIAACR